MYGNALNANIILGGNDVSESMAAAQQPRMNALRMQAQRQQMNANALAQKEAAIGKLARMVISSDNPAEAYPRALQAAQMMGIPTTGMPAQYSPEIGQQLQMAASVLGLPPDQRTEFERTLEALPPEQRRQALMVHAGLAPKAGDNVPSGFRPGPNGSLEPIPGGPADPAYKASVRGPGIRLDTNNDGVPDVMIGGGKFTEAQSKDNVFATRAAGALPTLNENADALTSYSDQILGADPTGVLRGNLQSPEYQVARAAADEFLGAILRKDTGAAITDKEYEIYGRTFLPQPGDQPEVLAYKREARQRAINAIKAGMSPAQILAQERALAMGQGGGARPAQPGAVQSGATPAVDASGLSDEELLKALGIK